MRINKALMTTDNFCYWIQGFVELTDGQDRPNEKQWKMIKRHLDLVFDNITAEPEAKIVKLVPKLKPLEIDLEKLLDRVGGRRYC